MRTVPICTAIVAMLAASSATAGKLEGPARFCGYSPIIDLEAGETVWTLEGGIHGGTFRWDGDFGSLEVNGIGWASRPKGQMVREPQDDRPARFEQRYSEREYVVAVWNGRQAAAYFSSAKPMTRRQLEAIDRVRLFQEGETPEDCNLRTTFSWE